MEPSDYFFSFALRRQYPTVFCVGYKTANKTLIFCGMKTNSIYSVEIKYLFTVKAGSKWVVQVVEEICTRTGKWHRKVRFSSSILTIAPLFLFLETFRQHLPYFCKQQKSATGDYFDLACPRSVVEIITSVVINVSVECCGQASLTAEQGAWL